MWEKIKSMMLTWVHARNYVLDGGPNPPMQRGNFELEKGRPIRRSLLWAVQKRPKQLKRHLGCGLRWAKEPRIRWGPDPTREWVILRANRGRFRSCQDMSGGRYIQSNSAGGSTGTAWMSIGVYRWGWTLAPPSKYDWTIHVRWRCGLMSIILTTCCYLTCQISINMIC